jgi:peptide/nickel transport system substrate-binding protein
MHKLRRLSTLRVLAILGVLVLVLAACAAPTTTAPAAEAPAAEEAAAEAPATGDLPAEPGRGTDGTVTLLYWQPPSLVNVFLSGGTKEAHATSLVLEPLLRIAPDGSLVANLVKEVPTKENGLVAEDDTSITYNLLEGVLWSDGTPFTADDVVFSYEYCSNPDTGCAYADKFGGIESVEAVDPLTVKITYTTPRPFPYNPFVGQTSIVLQKAQFADCVGVAAQGCAEANTMPIGTGPYKVKEFVVNDTIVYEVNENYRVENQPHFAEVIITAAPDAVASARAVLETSEADYGWNLQVEAEILNGMEALGNGVVIKPTAGSMERILLNQVDSGPDAGDKRGVWTPEDRNPHPFLTDEVVREALALALDPTLIATQFYGAAGAPTCNVLMAPAAAYSTNNDDCLVQDLEGAAALLEGAGWVDSDGDGIREKDGVVLNVLYQTSTNAVRQKTQALIQQWWNEIGVGVELKNVDAGVYFGSDPASPDTYGKFWADVEMFTSSQASPDPEDVLSAYQCFLPNGDINISTESTAWAGSNIVRWCSEEYDAKFQEFQTLTGDARMAAAIELNDMIVQSHTVLPLVNRASVSAHTNSLGGIEPNGWDSELWQIEDWYRVR